MTGQRAIILALLVVVLAAVLAWALKDGGVFTTATSTSIIGKFGYDAARDISQTRATTPAVAEPVEEYGD